MKLYTFKRLPLSLVIYKAGYYFHPFGNKEAGELYTREVGILIPKIFEIMVEFLTNFRIENIYFLAPQADFS